MLPPLISFVCFNRLGLTIKNLESILASKDDFELYIIDNNSKDGTWEYIEQLEDPRIKEKKRFDKNRWVIYALNYVISHRKPGQYLISIDNDVNILTPDFVSQFITFMDSFPDLGMSGVMEPNILQDLFERRIIKSAETVIKNDLFYIKIAQLAGCCLCFRPELLDQIGYVNEETFDADKDVCYRINKHTKWHTGLIPSKFIKISRPASILCGNCKIKSTCTLSVPAGELPGCHKYYKDARGKVIDFCRTIKVYKLSTYYRELDSGKRTPYCASIHDPESMKNHFYNKEWADENFNFFIENSN